MIRSAGLWCRGAMFAARVLCGLLCLNFPAHAVHIAHGAMDLTPAEQLWLAEHPVIRVGSDPNWPPIDFRDDQGQRSGVTTQMLLDIGEQLGLRFEWIEMQDWNHVIAAAKRREVDLLSTIGLTTERQQYLTFTEPFMRFQSVIVVRDDADYVKDMSSLSEATFALGESYAETTTFKQRYPQYPYVLRPSMREALITVAAGEADATVGNVAVASYLISKLSLSNLRIAGPFVKEERTIHLAVRKDWPELASILDKALRSIPEAELLELQAQWVPAVAQQGMDPDTVRNSAIAAALALLVIGGMLGLWMRGMRRELEYRRISESRIQAAQKLLREVTDRIPGGAVYQYTRLKDGSIHGNFVSDGLVQLSGVSRQELLSNYASAASRIHPDDRDKVRQAVEESARTMTPYEVEYRIPATDGGVTWVRGSASPRPGPDGSIVWNGFTTFITELKRVEAEIRAAREYVIEITRSLPGVVYQSALLRDGTVELLFNPDGYRQLMGLQGNGAHLHYSELMAALHPDDAESLYDALANSAAEMKPILTEFRLKSAPGEPERWVRIEAAAKPATREDMVAVWNGYGLDITERKRLEADLAAKQRQLHDITNTIPGALLQVRAEAGGMRVMFTSGRLNQRRGIDEARALRDFSYLQDLIVEEDRPATLKAMAQAARTLEPFRHEYRTRLDDGTVRWNLAEAVPHREADGAVVATAYITDTTERKQLEEQLAATQRQVDEIARSLPGVIYQAAFYADGTLDLRYNAEGYFRLMGLEPGPARFPISHMFEATLTEDQESLAEAVTRSATELTPLSTDFRVRAADGSPRWLRIEAVPQAGPTVDVMVIWNAYGVDITERKQLEMELASAKETAEAASRAKGEFLANMSHEIRTPMNAIIGLAHLGLRADPEPRVRDYVEKIQSSAHTLLGVINDILDFSKIEAGKLGLENNAFRMDDVFTNLANIVSLKAAEKGLELLFSLPPATPHVRGDPLRLGQVLLNLTSNAIKFTDRGQVLVGVRELKREEHAEPVSPADGAAPSGRAWLEFSVRDTGIGMSPEQTARLFESFTQADASITRKYGGTGLGLSISKRLVTMMGGNIEVISSAGNGSTFRFSIPMGLAGDLEHDPASSMPAQVLGARVLVAEDNADAREILAMHLRAFGFNAHLVHSGAEALAALEQAWASGEPYRVLLLDSRMPDTSGVEVARKIRARENVEAPKIVLIADYASAESTRHVRRLGLDGLLLKPINASELLDTLLAVLGAGVVQPRASRAAALGAGSLRGQSVLVVEDNALNQQVMRELLESAGAEVHVAEDGAAALGMCEQRAYGALLMDLQMPVMGGIECTERLRALGSTVAIIAMTASAMPSDRERCLRAGMNEFLSKPVDVDKLAAALLRWLPALAMPPTAADGERPVSVPPELLAQLRSQLRANDSAAADTVEALSRRYNGAAPRVLRELTRLVDGFNFEAALLKLDEYASAAANEESA